MRIFLFFLVAIISFEISGSYSGAVAHPSSWQDYTKKIIRKIQSQKRIPEKSGNVTIKFVVAKSGKLLSARTIKNSGGRQIEREALNMIRRAAPFPPMPEYITKPQSFMMPIYFVSGKAVVTNDYKKLVTRRILNYRGFQHIPGAKGKVKAQASLVIAPSGKIRSAHIVKSSQKKAIDLQIIKMIKNLPALPPIPKNVKGSIRLTLPVTYIIK
ncbi:MAG: energy transducer TonB family protein [Methyloligellaceae bacterium]